MAVFRDKNPLRKVGQWLHTGIRKLGFKGTNLQSKTAGSTAGSRPLTVSRGRKPYIIAGSALALLAIAGFGTQQYISSNTVDYYHVYRDGQEIGTISNPQQVEDLLAEKQKQVEQANPGIQMVLAAGKLEYTESSGFKAVPNSEETLEKLGGLVKPMRWC